jgi:hypothetical protein
LSLIDGRIFRLREQHERFSTPLQVRADEKRGVLEQSGFSAALGSVLAVRSAVAGYAFQYASYQSCKSMDHDWVIR